MEDRDDMYSDSKTRASHYQSKRIRELEVAVERYQHIEADFIDQDENADYIYDDYQYCKSPGSLASKLTGEYSP
jgi:hypothetical protein